MRVLVTGAAGSIGRVVTAGLVERGHEVIGLDLVDAPVGHELGAGGSWHVGDCADPAVVDGVLAATSPEAVLHLAGVPDEASLPDELTSHVITTAALLDAMLAHGVTRIVYASSNHAVGRTPHDGVLTVDAAPRPDTFYGVAKVAAEALLRLYSERHGIDAVACRIGSFLERPATTRGLSTWLSHGDAVRMVEAALTTPSPGFAVLYGISANTRAWWDLEPGRALGYDPVDDAEDFAGEVPARDEDADEASYVGGPFAGPQFHRPALGD